MVKRFVRRAKKFCTARRRWIIITGRRTTFAGRAGGPPTNKPARATAADGTAAMGPRQRRARDDTQLTRPRPSHTESALAADH